jgi:hypothetical protein
MTGIRSSWLRAESLGQFWTTVVTRGSARRFCRLRGGGQARSEGLAPAALGGGVQEAAPDVAGDRHNDSDLGFGKPVSLMRDQQVCPRFRSPSSLTASAGRDGRYSSSSCWDEASYRGCRSFQDGLPAREDRDHSSPDDLVLTIQKPLIESLCRRGDNNCAKPRRPCSLQCWECPLFVLNPSPLDECPRSPPNGAGSACRIGVERVRRPARAARSKYGRARQPCVLERKRCREQGGPSVVQLLIPVGFKGAVQ